jgi:hypothetical protein
MSYRESKASIWNPYQNVSFSIFYPWIEK